jgi:hypothetical protein
MWWWKRLSRLINIGRSSEKELLVNLQEIQNTLQPIDDLWNSQNVAGVVHLMEHMMMPAFRSWHGYGWREEATGLVVSPFVSNPQDLDAIVARIAASLPPEVKVEGIVMPPFQEIGSGTPKELPDPFHPGNVVIGDCSSAHIGTIGGFLTAEDDDSTWLLSNRHVLTECPSGQLIGANFTVLGSDVRSVPPQPKNNIVDAAVVKIENPSEVNPRFEELGRVAQPTLLTMARLQEGTAVRKLGNVTGVTSGKLVLHCPKVNVEDKAGVVREFVHQLAIIPNGQIGLFADDGDSGSLIVTGGPDAGDSGSTIASDEHVIGLLFASSIASAIEIPVGQSLKPPFYLANRWDNVIQELSAPEIVGSPLKLMLSKKAAATH